MSFTPVEYVEGVTIIHAQNLNDIQDEFGNKVDKVEGKALSTNDFTDALKNKLDGIEAQANKTLYDTTLSQTRQAADAKATGNAIAKTVREMGNLEQDADLNTMKAPGLWCAATTTIVNSLSNYPSTNTGVLAVFATRESGTFGFAQVVVTGSEMFSRYYGGSAWTAWVKQRLDVDDALYNLGEAADAKVAGRFLDAISNVTGLDIDLSFLFSFEDGHRINYATGAYQTSASYATSGYIDVSRFDKIKLLMPIGTASSVAGLAFFDPSKEYISGVQDHYDTSASAISYEERIIDVPATAKYLRTSWVATTYATYSDFPAFIFVGIKDAEELPAYYFADGYIDGRVATIIGHEASNSIHGDAFFWFTDPHTWRNNLNTPLNGLNSVKLIEYIRSRTNIRRVVCGGDIEQGTTMTAPQCTALISAWLSYMQPVWPDTYVVIGNHEYNNPGNTSEQEVNELDTPQLYAMLCKDKENDYISISDCGDYAFDNKLQKIRYFCITAQQASTIGKDQVKWFGHLLEDTPSGYTVVVLSHLGISSDQNGNLGELSADSDYTSRFSAIVRCMNAAKTKSVYTSTPYAADSEVFDYTNLNNVTIACAITGHLHRDCWGVTEEGIPIITTTCDRGPTSETSAEWNAARAYGTIGEQAIDVVQIDTDNQNIYLTRIGGSLLESPDRSFSYGGD